MEPDRDAVLRLAAERHPAAAAPGSLHLAQHRLAATTTAFVQVMADAGRPGACLLPAPRGRSRWSRSHLARATRGWPLAVPVDATFECWVDTDGQWWLIRVDGEGAALDAHTVGTPLSRADELPAYTGALLAVLDAHGLGDGLDGSPG